MELEDILSIGVGYSAALLSLGAPLAYGLYAGAAESLGGEVSKYALPVFGGSVLAAGFSQALVEESAFRGVVKTATLGALAPVLYLGGYTVSYMGVKAFGWNHN